LKDVVAVGWRKRPHVRHGRIDANAEVGGTVGRSGEVVRKLPVCSDGSRRQSFHELTLDCRGGARSLVVVDRRSAERPAREGPDGIRVCLVGRISIGRNEPGPPVGSSVPALFNGAGSEVLAEADAAAALAVPRTTANPNVVGLRGSRAQLQKAITQCPSSLRDRVDCKGRRGVGDLSFRLTGQRSSRGGSQREPRSDGETKR
jgi:hypothetical protein